MPNLNPAYLKQLAGDWFLPLTLAGNRRLPATIMIREHSGQDGKCQFAERFLQALWNEQRLSGPLTTATGVAFEVLSPGTWNVSAGPDFRNAVLRMAGEVVRGDIEVHRTVADWHAHGHDRDEAYNKVILHVVWRQGANASTPSLPPTFELAGRVDTGLETLSRELAPESYPYGRKVGPGRCAGQLSPLTDEQLVNLFGAAGFARLAAKSEAMLKRIAEWGGDQTLYAGVMTALGYRRNQDAFRRLATAAPLSLLHQLDSDDARQACLWGLAGLLPDPTSTPVVAPLRGRAMKLWRLWWKTGIPKGEIAWHRAGSRPLNSPERRLAAACAWLEKCQFSPQKQVLKAARKATSGDDFQHSLGQDLVADEVWAKHVSFQHALKQPARLLGENRRRDLVVNVFIPFLHALGTHGGDHQLTELAEEAWLRAPKLQNNRLLAEAAHRFLYPPSRAAKVIRKACEQQGALEMYRSLCIQCGGNCEQCPLTSIVPTGNIAMTN